MIDVAKGDIVLEPLGWLVELLVRLLGRAWFRNPPVESVEQWGWPEWLWAALFIALAVFLVSYLMGRRVRADRHRSGQGDLG